MKAYTPYFQVHGTTNNHILYHRPFILFIVGDEMYPDFIDMEDVDIAVVENLPNCQIQNRLLMGGEYNMKLFVRNFTSKDRHLPPVDT